jgi:hypothetical protein
MCVERLSKGVGTWRNTWGHILVKNLISVMSVGRQLLLKQLFRNTRLNILVTSVLSAKRHFLIKAAYCSTWKHMIVFVYVMSVGRHLVREEIYRDMGVHIHSTILNHINLIIVMSAGSHTVVSRICRNMWKYIRSHTFDRLHKCDVLWEGICPYRNLCRYTRTCTGGKQCLWQGTRSYRKLN